MAQFFRNIDFLQKKILEKKAEEKVYFIYIQKKGSHVTNKRSVSAFLTTDLKEINILKISLPLGVRADDWSIHTLIISHFVYILQYKDLQWKRCALGTSTEVVYVEFAAPLQPLLN